MTAPNTGIDNDAEKSTSNEPLDAVVIGAGFAGLYMIYSLRKAGFRGVCYEAGQGVGGTWFWNRYPGARCDVESLDYSYKFSEELQREWQWTERYPAQAEILKYINYVADRFDLRRDIKLNSQVKAAHFDEATNLWTVRTQTGEVVRAKFVITALGLLSTTNIPKIPGLERYKGPTYHTGRWPEQPVDFTNQRVAVIGTGSSGVQMIPEIAKQAAHLTVFQRTPNYSLPARNRPLTEEERQTYRTNFLRNRDVARSSQYGSAYSDVLQVHRSALDDDADTRERVYQSRWELGGGGIVRSYDDLLTNPEANKTAAEFVRARIRDVVKDPETAEALTPYDHHLGTKRPCIDTGYFETFNRPNVSLVNLKKEPIAEIVEDGIKTSKKSYSFDALVFATGFDAMTGSLLRVDFQGARQARLSEKWYAGPRTMLGVMTHGFPNMFMVTGPGSPSAIGNVVVSIEQHVDWITECLTYLRENGVARIDANLQAENEWMEHVSATAGKTLFPTCEHSWYMGANIPGKPRVFMPYLGGIGTYRRKCDDIAKAGYEGFDLSAK